MERDERREQSMIATERVTVRGAVLPVILSIRDAIDEALQQAVVRRLTGDPLDRLGLDAPKDARGPIGNGEAAARNAIDRKSASIIEPQIGAAIGATLATATVTVKT